MKHTKLAVIFAFSILFASCGSDEQQQNALATTANETDFIKTCDKPAHSLFSSIKQFTDNNYQGLQRQEHTYVGLSGAYTECVKIINDSANTTQYRYNLKDKSYILDIRSKEFLAYETGLLEQGKTLKPATYTTISKKEFVDERNNLEWANIVYDAKLNPKMSVYTKKIDGKYVNFQAIIIPGVANIYQKSNMTPETISDPPKHTINNGIITKEDPGISTTKAYLIKGL